MLERILDLGVEFAESPLWSKAYMILHPTANYHARLLAWYKHIDILNKDYIKNDLLSYKCMKAKIKTLKEKSNKKIKYGD